MDGKRKVKLRFKKFHVGGEERVMELPCASDTILVSPSSLDCLVNNVFTYRQWVEPRNAVVRE